MSENLSLAVLRGLVTDEVYMRKVIPFLRTNYFEGSHKEVYKQVAKFIDKYNSAPTIEAMRIELEGNEKMSDAMFSEVSAVLPELFVENDLDHTFIINQTEEWCKDRAMTIAILEAVEILNGTSKSGAAKTAIPDMMHDALGVGFDQTVGHDYIEDFAERYSFYHEDVMRIPFDLDIFNKITKGGLPLKTLNIALAGTGVGKSLFMCHVAAAAMMQGKNVLYITMEMAEERIAERIDANLLDIPIDQIDKLPQKKFQEKVMKLKTKTTGKLVIKEYPTGAANASHFRALLKELALKREFKPDLVVIDYLNICSSSRMKSMGGAINSYTYIKAIAEELRGLGVEFDVPVLSATQTTRSGYANSDPGLEDTSESFGLPATADLMFALISDENLEAQNLIKVKQLKNRYNDPGFYKTFTLGIDRSKMRLYDAELPDSPLPQTEGSMTDDSVPVFERSNTGQRVSAEKIKDFKI